MRGVIRFFHTAPVVQDQSAGNSGHAVSNLPEGKAVWVEIWIEANLIHIRPVEVIPEETDQSSAYLSIFKAPAKAGGVVEH